jgi:putative DNA primase/helicase
MDVLAALGLSGPGPWQALCPAHADRNPSLSVTVGDDGRRLLYCHAGCATEVIVARLGGTMADLFPANSSSGPAKKVFDFADHLSDVGNARRFAHQWGNAVRYVPAWKTWLLWTGQRWERDEIGGIWAYARETVRNIYAEAEDTDAPADRKAIASWALRSEGETRIRAMVTLAQSELGIPLTPGALDADPWLLNCENGTLDLRTGVLRPHNRLDLITRKVEVAYDPTAECPLWLTFLKRVMKGNTELIAFLQRGVGYSLTGDVREQCFFVLYGDGSNGKTTFITTNQRLLGQYAGETPFDTLLVRHQGSATNDLARLIGKRFVSAAEGDEGVRLTEAKIKRLTGRDRVTARFLHKEYYEFEPAFKLWLSTNHKPIIRGTDHGFWRRPRLVPFTETISKAEQDPEFPEKLAVELPGILRWAVEGSLEWQRIGLCTPPEVMAATTDYRREMDRLGVFLDERCVMDSAATETAGLLYQEYRAWAATNGEEPITKTMFGRSLTERGLTAKTNGAQRFWVGVRLKR